MTYSSGVWARTYPFHHECKNCGWAGMVDADYDPEVNDEVVTAICERCDTSEVIEVV